MRSTPFIGQPLYPMWDNTLTVYCIATSESIIISLRHFRISPRLSMSVHSLINNHSVKRNALIVGVQLGFLRSALLYLLLTLWPRFLFPSFDDPPLPALPCALTLLSPCSVS
jgi:hypothetical protein